MWPKALMVAFMLAGSQSDTPVNQEYVEVPVTIWNVQDYERPLPACHWSGSCGAGAYNDAYEVRRPSYGRGYGPGGGYSYDGGYGRGYGGGNYGYRPRYEYEREKIPDRCCR